MVNITKAKDAKNPSAYLERCRIIGRDSTDLEVDFDYYCQTSEKSIQEAAELIDVEYETFIDVCAGVGTIPDFFKVDKMKTYVCEKNYERYMELQKKNYNILSRDFLDISVKCKIDLVVTNPPYFERYYNPIVENIFKVIDFKLALIYCPSIYTEWLGYMCECLGFSLELHKLKSNPCGYDVNVFIAKIKKINGNINT